MSIDNLIALSEEKDVRPGHDAGWLLAFHTEEDDFKISKEPVCELSRDGYYGEIIAALPSGLEGGSMHGARTSYSPSVLLGSYPYSGAEKPQACQGGRLPPAGTVARSWVCQPIARESSYPLRARN